MSISVSIVESSPKAVVNSSIPDGMIVACSISAIVSLSEATLDVGLIVFLSPVSGCSGQDVSCSKWSGLMEPKCRESDSLLFAKADSSNGSECSTSCYCSNDEILLRAPSGLGFIANEVVFCGC